MRTQFIGTVAAELGVNSRTLRYYEAMGLLPSPSRTQSGYRVYDSRTGFRVRFIRKAKNLGLSLKEIQAMLEIYNSGKPPCRSFQRLLQAHVRRIDTQIQHLRLLRRDLRSLLTRWPDQCETGRNGVCPRLEAFTGTTRETIRLLKGG
ncbi:MAG TPA: MerR family DNA-binding protein [Candidatus Acidoferrales bacterium]|nr:MerR family DNA-binding protein [Candidatus Acidoferrales bacterium]